MAVFDANSFLAHRSKYHQFVDEGRVQSWVDRSVFGSNVKRMYRDMTITIHDHIGTIETVDAVEYVRTRRNEDHFFIAQLVNPDDIFHYVGLWYNHTRMELMILDPHHPFYSLDPNLRRVHNYERLVNIAFRRLPGLTILPASHYFGNFTVDVGDGEYSLQCEAPQMLENRYLLEQNITPGLQDCLLWCFIMLTYATARRKLPNTPFGCYTLALHFIDRL